MIATQCQRIRHSTTGSPLKRNGRGSKRRSGHRTYHHCRSGARSCGWRNCWRRRGSTTRTRREFERTDSSNPIQSRGLIVHVCVPESAIICGIDRHRAVIAPSRANTATAVSRLNAGGDSWQHGDFSLRQAVEGIGGEPSGISNIRCHRRARSAVTHSHIANMIDCE